MRPEVQQSPKVDEDTAVWAFLKALGRDVAAGNVSPMPQDLLNRALPLAKGRRVDADSSFDDAMCL